MKVFDIVLAFVTPI